MALFGALLALIPEEKALWLDSLYKSSSLKKRRTRLTLEDSILRN